MSIRGEGERDTRTGTLMPTCAQVHILKPPRHTAEHLPINTCMRTCFQMIGFQNISLSVYL